MGKSDEPQECPKCGGGLSVPQEPKTYGHKICRECRYLVTFSEKLHEVIMPNIRGLHWDGGK